jgi:hypothetical protein
MNQRLMNALAKVVGDYLPGKGIISYEAASEMLGKKDSKKIENNTYLVKTQDGFGIKLHNTIVVKILPHGLFSLHTGGYFTNTTKDRINNYAPVNIYSEKGDWYFGGRDKKTRILFSDGIIVDTKGDVVG